MVIQAKSQADVLVAVQPSVRINDQDFRAGFEEAQEPYYADCGIRTDMGLSEHQLRRSTGFIIGILSRE